HGVDEPPAAGLAEPRVDGADGGPTVERRVQLDGAELARVVVEPFIARRPAGIEAVPPVPVEPAGAADVDAGFDVGGGAFGRCCFEGAASDMHSLRAANVLLALLGATFFSSLAPF